MSKIQSNMIRVAARNDRSLSVALRMFVALACLCTPFTMRLQGQNTPQVIDGSLNPEMIPDWRAYSLLFRFISNHWNENRDAMLAYLNTIGLNGESPTRDKAQLDTLVATAQEFAKRSADLDTSLREALTRNPNLSLDREAHRLEQEKKQLTLETVSRLETRLGLVDAERVRQHIGKMKRKMKMIQTMP